MMPFSALSTTGAAKPVFALLLVVLSTLTPLVASHALMAEPIPYASPIQANGPVEGSTFPCHNGGGALTPPASGYNIYPLGSKQPLKFTGTAIHGGGSCQISITYDTPVTKDSKFKVIKSIEGGCPARNEAANRNGDSAEQPNPDEYEFTIPDDIPTGNGTIAWTWFNKIGNREMYMACAPLQLTGTDKPNAKQNFDSLPEIFKANIGNGCGTPDSKDILFPNPGKNVEKLNGKTEAFATPTGQGCEKPSAGGAAATTAGGGAATSVAPGTSAAATGTTKASSAAASSAPASAPAPTGGVFVTTAVSAAASTGTAGATGVFVTVPSDGAASATGTATVQPVSSSTAAPPASSSAVASSAQACSAPAASSSPAAAPSSSAAAASPSSSSAASSTIPSTLQTSTLPGTTTTTTTTTIAASAAGTSARAETLAETVPPTGACPATQDGWYICHLAAGANYGSFYHRCASGRWTDKMPVPKGMQCTIKGSVTDAAARNAPEAELTLEIDEPLKIIPVSNTETQLVTYRSEPTGTTGVAVTTASMNAPVRATGAPETKRRKRDESGEDFYSYETTEEVSQEQDQEQEVDSTVERRIEGDRKAIINSKKPAPRFFRSSRRHFARHGHGQHKHDHGRKKRWNEVEVERVEEKRNGNDDAEDYYEFS